MKVPKEHKQQQSRVVQKVQMSSEKIQKLKELPCEFEGITLYHGDDRNYLRDIELSPVNTIDWDKSRQKIIQDIPRANKVQETVYNLVKGLNIHEFNAYINTWIYSPNQGYEKTMNLIKPEGFFNGCCCCFEKDKAAKKKYTYEIELTGKFNQVKKSNIQVLKNALYECDNIKLQFAQVNTDQGEVDILSPVPSNCITLVSSAPD